jgi:hypothetical protein
VVHHACTFVTIRNGLQCMQAKLAINNVYTKVYSRRKIPTIFASYFVVYIVKLLFLVKISSLEPQNKESKICSNLLVLLVICYTRNDGMRGRCNYTCPKEVWLGSFITHSYGHFDLLPLDALLISSIQSQL